MARPTLHAGDRGPYVKAMQLGLRRALGPTATNLANGAYGARTIRDVERFKRANRIFANGSIFGQTAWTALDKSLPFVQRVKVAVMPTPPPPTAEELARKRIVAEALWLIANRYLFTYAQVRPMPVPPNLRDPRWHQRWDCSSTATACYSTARAPDPNGNGYKGAGNTWMMVARGRWTTAPKPGDLCFYGPAPNNPTHVAIYIGDGKVVSFGHTPPTIYSVHYRLDYLGTRTYAVV